jgi:formylglycine-generating enzyme required for sulfatase activity
MAQWLDARDGPTDENLRRLVAAVQSALRGEEPSKTGLDKAVGQKARLVALATLALVALVVTYWMWPRSSAGTHGVADNNTKDSTTKPDGNSKTDSTAKADAIGKKTSERKTWLNPADGETYVWIPEGTFIMGCSAGDGQCTDDEKPAHPVEIEKGFWLARTETTIGAYRKLAARLKVEAPQGDINLPASGVTWAQAKRYCAAVKGRLPSEAEWEYAARGGTSGAYYGAVPGIAWYADNSGGAPHPVGTKKPNGYGLYDMLGNVSEWVLDRYFNKYDLTAPATGAGIELPLASNAYAVARGGFWDGDAATIRVSHRNGRPVDDAEPIVGFRCASDI